ncbi:putative 2-aminoethylphosphonate ABC transporter permease subunit [Chitinimonas sp.]|uniref:putative 2-aminoethylphosphonate ABC transporter permease subunit n=1 Tax=Chitinimonas sp. TaxID=1934313 RepID=UPI002F938C41
MSVLALPWRAGMGALRSRDEQLAAGLVWLLAAALLLFLAWPLSAILVKALQARDGSYVGLANLWELAAEPRMRVAVWNSVYLALMTLGLVLPLALAFAFALTRSRIWGKPAFRLAALVPLLAPSLMPAISLVYLFGNQGLLKSWLGDASIYGPVGIVLGEIFYTFPHALLILVTALSVADARLYEAAETLGAGKLRRFLTVTLPNARYGLISAGLVVFTLVVTDFGVPKVIGGQTNVLALEAYKQVIGQQNFGKGAVVGLLLLLPAVLSVLVERWLARGHGAAMSGRSVAYKPGRNRGRDALLWLFCGGMSAFLLALLGVAVAAALMKLWPYNLSLTLDHFDFDQVDGGGWLAFRNSLKLSGYTALLGTALVFVCAYLNLKTPAPRLPAALIRSLALLPMAVPGLVLGLGYIFCFNNPANPLHGLYGGMAILVAATIVHFYTTAHLTLTTSLRQIDPEIEAVARSLRRPWWRSCLQVTLPISLPALLDVARYLFVSSMTTVSCVIFLYTPDTVLASVAVLNMDDAGDTAAAAAMASLIVASSLCATLLINAAGWLLNRRAQAWRVA